MSLGGFEFLNVQDRPSLSLSHCLVPTDKYVKLTTTSPAPCLSASGHNKYRLTIQNSKQVNS